MTATSSAADHRGRFEARLHKDAAGQTLPYRLLSPKELKPGEKYPLVLFFHGAGECGADNEKQLIHGMNDFASDEIMAKFPAFVVAPQCPLGQQWVDTPWSADAHTMKEKPTDSLRQSLELVDALVKALPVDEKRLYITGLSMGGFGVWDAIQRHPDRFAAAVVVCGGGDPAYAARIKHIPVWAFHGDSDTAVKPRRSREMIEALKRAGGNPKHTEYEKTGHDAWTRTYADPQVYEWLFAQHKL
ncbi:MAG TPA: prolyl oligopeptidase family serine peptidase [Pirellulaceae bacterium]|nr:prolyl oligopeptidase family serine peptidase [Pirellulaceae bacterium]